MQTCQTCGKELTKDEIALHKRLINRGAQEHLCIECLAKHLKVSVPLLEEKMQFLKDMGCTLFK